MPPRPTRGRFRKVLDQITPLILTYNEAPNIRRTLERLRWADDIVLVDSFSNDETLEIASEFPQVRIYQRAFDSHGSQWNFGLKETCITTSWVLALDADYILTDELVSELELLHPAEGTSGYRADFSYCVHGKRLRSGVYPPVTVLYRQDRASYNQVGHTQKLYLEGKVDTLLGQILHDDRKPLSRWFQSQVRYAELECGSLQTTAPTNLSRTDRMRRWGIIAPPAMLFYCLILRGGIFDGWAGFYYAFQRTMAELLLSLYLIEYLIGWGLRSGSSTQKSLLLDPHSAAPKANPPSTELKARN
jgi:glycosyltransferase involved in cell wall biosynthesis